MARYTAEERRKLRALKRLSSARDSEFEGFVTHSTMYHRMFEGYSERQVPNPNGVGTHIERVYVGNFFERTSEGTPLSLAKVIYTVLFLLAALCAVLAFSCSTTFNSVWYGVVPMFALIILMLLFLSNLISCLAAPKRMELYHYNCFGRLMQSALRIAVTAFVYALLSVLFQILSPAVQGTWQVTLWAALAGFLSLAIFFLERNSRYDVIENENEPAHDAVVIS